MSRHILSVIVAFAAYSILDLAKAIQKIAMEKGRSNKALGVLIWLAATASTTVSSLLLLYAVSLGSVLIVGAMGGSGLVALTLFSVIVMKERTSRSEIIGVVAILAGPVVMATFQGTQIDVPDVRAILWFIGIVCAAYLVSILLAHRKSRIVGLLIGGFAGALGGAVLLLQKIATTFHGRSHTWITTLESDVHGSFLKSVVEVLVNPFSLGWVLLSIASTVVLQFSYRYDRAIRIVPVFAANTILAPVVGGLLGFRETLHPAQWAAVVLILIGTGLVTVRRGQPDAAE